jgi:hypothetical protein
MGLKAASLLIAEQNPLATHRSDGRLEGFDGIPVHVVPGLISITVSAEREGQRGRTSTAV